MGIRGINFFARKIMDWPKLAGNIEQLSHHVMMISIILEEVGTGGAGFRWIYATFLQNAAKILDNQDLAEQAKAMMENGDRWQEISFFAAKIGKRRDLGQERLAELANLIRERAKTEKEIFTRLAAIVK